MAILLIAPGRSEEWLHGLLHVDPTLDIRVWPDVGSKEDIHFACLWRYPHGELLNYPNLKAISSLGAGVDHIFSDPKLPKNIRVARVVDKLLMRDMSQFIILAVLNHTREFITYHEQQLESKWLWRGIHSEKTIGMMGLGELGKDAALKLKMLGFEVRGFSREEKNIPGIKSFFGGEAAFHDFLAGTDILINLLPLTSETTNILNTKTFSHLKKGAYLISVARGGHLAEDDLLKALADKQLSGACLDVFNEEPLPVTHPFWTNPKIIMTPHVASVTNPASVCEQLVLNYKNALANKPLINEIDILRKY